MAIVTQATVDISNRHCGYPLMAFVHHTKRFPLDSAAWRVRNNGWEGEHRGVITGSASGPQQTAQYIFSRHYSSPPAAIMPLAVVTPEDAPLDHAELAESPQAQSDLVAQAWDWICWTGVKTYDGLDFAGEVLANFLGLTQSQYQWMIDMKEREEADKRQRKLEARQRRQLRLEQLLEEEKRKLQELEKGAPGPADDGDDTDPHI